MQTLNDNLSKYNELKLQLKELTKERNKALSLKIMNERYKNDIDYKERRRIKSHEYYHNKQKLKNEEKKKV
jgi:hypothetical protein